MSGNAWFQVILYFGLLTALAGPLGAWMARVYEAERVGRVEGVMYRLLRTGPADEMTWRRYAAALLWFSVLSMLAVFAIQLAQGFLPLNPAGMGPVRWDLALNTAISFATNTNWQAYGGESTLSYLTQALALGVQNFVSAAAGMAVLVALVRGIQRRQTPTIGNFWVDLTRGTLYILLPLSIVLATLLISQGVVQTWGGGVHGMALGPVAGQVAIKQLGTNGGGFFNVNSAHPFENPTPLSNLAEMLAILLIPAALCHTFGRMVRDRRQGWALLAAMTIVLVPLVVGIAAAEQHGTPLVAPNLEGKEVRFGTVTSAIWAGATTAASNGSVNAMHDSFTPLGGLVPMWLMQLGEVIYGGAGSGLYGMLVFALVAVFIAGLMVGRTPEYLGKKIEAFEMRMSAVAILVPAGFVLAGTALGISTAAGRAGIFNGGAHGFSEVLYAFSSGANNNGSAFAGLGANAVFWNLSLGVAMWFGRFGVALPVLAIAGALARKKRVPVSAGTLPTHTPLFVVLLIATIVLVGALTFLPALALGPIVEQLEMVIR